MPKEPERDARRRVDGVGTAWVRCGGRRGGGRLERACERGRASVRGGVERPAGGDQSAATAVTVTVYVPSPPVPTVRTVAVHTRLLALAYYA